MLLDQKLLDSESSQEITGQFLDLSPYQQNQLNEIFVELAFQH